MAANPFVLVAGLLAGLVVGLRHFYRTSEVFRDRVNAAFSAVAASWLKDAAAILRVLTSLVNGYLTASQKVIGVAATVAEALGMHELAGDLRNAQTRIGEFKDQANAHLRALETEITITADTLQAQQQLRNLQPTFGMLRTTATETLGGYVDSFVRSRALEPRALGGPVLPGRSYLVDGPEWLHMGVAAPPSYVTPSVPAVNVNVPVSMRGGDSSAPPATVVNFYGISTSTRRAGSRRRSTRPPGGRSPTTWRGSRCLTSRISPRSAGSRWRKAPASARQAWNPW